MPVLVKGIATPEAARLALQHGVQGIIVSNYGGLAGRGDALILHAAGHRRCRGRQGAGARRRQLPPRHRHPQSAGLRRASGAGRPAGHVGPGGVRRRRRAGGPRDAADRAGALHGDVRQVEPGDARPHGAAGARRARRPRRQRRSSARASERRSRESPWVRSRRWQQSTSRRKAIAGLAGVVAASPLCSRCWRRSRIRVRSASTSGARARRDDDRVRFRAGHVRQRAARRSTTTPRTATAPSSRSAATARRSTGSISCPGRPSIRRRVDLSTEILGTKMRYPDHGGADGGQVPLHPDGEIGMHRGGDRGVEHADDPEPQSRARPSTRSRPAATGPLWWQFYPQQDRDAGREMLDGAQAAGCTALVVTVDQQASYYERTQQDRNLGGRPAARRRPRRRAAAAAADRAGAAIACPRDASGTRGVPRRDSQDRQGADARQGHSHGRGREALRRARRWTASSSRITAADRWTTVPRRWRCCRRSWRP